MAVPHEPETAEARFDVAVVAATGDRVSIRAAGVLDDRARERLSALLDAELMAGHVFVRMDLSAVTLVGRSCLGTLKEVHDGCLASDGLLLIEGLCDEARQVLAAAGLDRCLFLSGTAGPPEWLPNLPGLADLVRHECASPTRSGPTPEPLRDDAVPGNRLRQLFEDPRGALIDDGVRSVRRDPRRDLDFASPREEDDGRGPCP